MYKTTNELRAIRGEFASPRASDREETRHPVTEAQLGVLWRAALDAGDAFALRVIGIATAPSVNDWIAKPHEQRAMALCAAAHDAMVARLEQVQS